MLNAVIIDQSDSEVLELSYNLEKFCPYLRCKGVISKLSQIDEELQMQSDSNILFINPDFLPITYRQRVKQLCYEGKSVICINDTNNFAGLAIEWRSSAYLKKPFKLNTLLNAIEEAKTLMEQKSRQQRNERLLQKFIKENELGKLIGIPTIKGFEIISIGDIIRCEGLQKCTRIVTKGKGGIVSSYNIGVFKKLLAPYSFFFSPHRSHIINIQEVEEYQKCGIIRLKDKSTVPISKCNKGKFLELIIHI